MTNKNKTVVVNALEETFQREAFCSSLKLMSLAKSCVKMTNMCLECFLEAAYIK